MQDQCETVIVGGGIAGLALAEMLHSAGRDFVLLESRDRLGGRVKMHQVQNQTFDLGPTWFWPGQSEIAQLVTRFKLEKQTQFTAGKLCVESEAGTVERTNYQNPMQGAYRLNGGIGGLITALSDGIGQTNIHLNARVDGVEIGDKLTIHIGDGRSITADRLVLSIPPRLVSRIKFSPNLDPNFMLSAESIPTWMAAQAKYVAIYPSPFWRRNGLSGTAFSQIGPMVEIHDAGYDNEPMGALFGFVGVPAKVRAGAEMAIKDAALNQLVRLFGAQAETPLITVLQDWSCETETTTPSDISSSGGNSAYGNPSLALSAADNRIILGAAETSATFSGLLEGALRRAGEIARQIL